MLKYIIYVIIIVIKIFFINHFYFMFYLIPNKLVLRFFKLTSKLEDKFNLDNILTYIL